MTTAVPVSLMPIEALCFDIQSASKPQYAQDFIRVENVSKTYHLGEVDIPALNGVSFSIGRGEMVALMGASGSGKTTLMNILGCLDRPSAGKYWLDGQEMSELSADERAMVRGAKIGFVFQNFSLLPRTTALNNVLMPLSYAVRRLSIAESKQRASQLLARAGLEQRFDYEPSQLSGGQQQRVAIARSLVNLPALVLADEPTGNLDSRTSVEILQTFQQLSAAGITVILVTHDSKVASFAHRTIRITDGLIESDNDSLPNPVPSPHVVRLSSDSKKYPTRMDKGDTATLSVAGLAPKSEKTADALTVSSQVRRRTMSAMLPAGFRTAATALRRNKLRSGLTMLGIVIGVSAVIAMVEIGQGSSYVIRQTIATMGANIVQIDPNGISVGGVNTGAGGKVTLTPGGLRGDPSGVSRSSLGGPQRGLPNAGCLWQPQLVASQHSRYDTRIPADTQLGQPAGRSSVH